MKPMILALMISNFIFTGIAYSATAAESYRINPNMKSRAAVASQKSYKSISPADARKRMNSGESVVLLDVRTPEEFAVKHIPGSILIPVEPVDLVTTDVEAVIVDVADPKSLTVFSPAAYGGGYLASDGLFGYKGGFRCSLQELEGELAARGREFSDLPEPERAAFESKRQVM